MLYKSRISSLIADSLGSACCRSLGYCWSLGKIPLWFPVLEDKRRKQEAPKELVQQRDETVPGQSQE